MLEVLKLNIRFFVVVLLKIPPKSEFSVSRALLVRKNKNPLQIQDFSMIDVCRSLGKGFVKF